mgnify:CR=1 FL=1
MVFGVKYGTWNVATCDPAALRVMVQAGYSPLAAQCLCARGYDTPQKARQLLESTDLRIGQVMAACGFQNQSSFNRVFREITGTSPRQYRKTE